MLMSSIESCNNSQYLYSFFPNSPANNRFLIKYSKEVEIILFEFNESCSFFIFWIPLNNFWIFITVRFESSSIALNDSIFLIKALGIFVNSSSSLLLDSKKFIKSLSSKLNSTSISESINILLHRLLIVERIPKSVISISSNKLNEVLKLIEKIEADDDVQNVYSNLYLKSN